ncbi:hypothetical protein C884_01231 [Kocuria palustris PEL]|uniref:Uncharacterized protein n=1 Tax=Kocuria palustris PEL TaxID=1236550 RepID=M2X9P6_9MICC|nr:hypothetical protein C884_01231 [Kocuria palustris PEL]
MMPSRSRCSVYRIDVYCDPQWRHDEIGAQLEDACQPTIR